MLNSLRKANEEYPSFSRVRFSVCCQCLSIVWNSLLSFLSRPHKRRNDYPLDQDCHLCHAIVIESTSRIGNIVSIENTKNVLKSICRTGQFEGYSNIEWNKENRYLLTPDEIRSLCDRFVADNLSQLQIAFLKYQMKKSPTSLDDQYCNTPAFCPNGWKRSSPSSETEDELMEEEL